jgi:uncharacterized protein YukE
MLRSDFETHPLWGSITSIEQGLDSLVDQAPEQEQPLISRIRFYLANVRTMGDVAASNAALVSQAMLDQVHGPISDVSTWVTNRINSGPGNGYLDNAANSAEATLIPLGPWPRPYGTGGQVKQMRTLYEELLEQQRLGVEELAAAHRRILDQVEAAESGLQTHAGTVRTEIDQLRTDASTVARTVDDQKARVDEVIAGGLAAVDELRTKNTESFEKFRGEESDRFESAFAPLREQIRTDVDRADALLEHLRDTNRKFENLSTAAAADLLAGEFAREARFGRQIGTAWYGIALVAIALAALPFLSLLADTTLDADGVVEWGRIVLRIALGVLLGSAAAVAVRVGGRFLAQASQTKQKELEFRAFEPFTANVGDREAVDIARLELVDRSFGRAGASSDDSKSDAVEVSTLARLLESLSKFVSR